jgi:hypothetical protein
MSTPDAHIMCIRGDHGVHVSICNYHGAHMWLSCPSLDDMWNFPCNTRASKSIRSKRANRVVEREHIHLRHMCMQHIMCPLYSHMDASSDVDTVHHLARAWTDWAVRDDHGTTQVHAHMHACIAVNLHVQL